jgi:hypothetical protein
MTNDEVRTNNGSPNGEEDVDLDVFAFLASSFSFIARSFGASDFDRARLPARDNQQSALAISNPKSTLA